MRGRVFWGYTNILICLLVNLHLAYDRDWTVEYEPIQFNFP